jgi:methyl-accepting chemotaxis protein
MDKEIKIITDAILEIIEDSNTISDIRNNLFDIEERQKYDHDDAIEQISQGVNDLQYDIQDDIDSLQQQIDELKDAIEDLKEKL